MPRQALRGCLNRLGGHEEAPALLALADAHELVLPAAHDRVVVLRGEVAHEVTPAGLCCFQLLSQARLELHRSMALSRPHDTSQMMLLDLS